MRRGIPASPAKCCTKKVTLKKIIVSQKWIWPSFSSYIRPVHFGSQKYTPANAANSAPATIT